MIAAGAMNERVTIQTATVTLGADFNDEILTWPADGVGTTVWARVKARGGREPLIADRPVMLVGYEVTIRSGQTVTNKQRLQWRGKTLGIESVTPNPAIGETVITCLEVSV